MENTEPKNKAKRFTRAYIPLIIVLVIVLAGGGIWLSRFLRYVTTDDALVDGDFVALAPKIMGRIANIYVNEGDSVKKHQLLVLLDSSDLYAQKLQAEAMVRQAMASLSQAVAKYKADEASISIYKISADKANVDFERAKVQKEKDVITEEMFENFQKAQQTSEAQLKTAEAQLKVSGSQVDLAKASLESASAAVNVLETQLRNTRLYSPFDGIVARRWLLPGDMAQMGQSVLNLNNNSNFWVSVYIEETKLKHIHDGQKAQFKIDAFPIAQFTGHIYFIGNNTASRYSLIPPSNASGNFTKITQRVQLKVTIDNVDKGNLKDYNIFPGMSVVMKLIK